MFRHLTGLIALVILVEAFKINDKNACMLNVNQCASQVDSPKHGTDLCQTLKCSGTYEHQCLKNVCTRSKTHCGEFKRDLFRMAKFHDIKLIENLIKNTKKCAIQEANSFREDDVCESDRNCFLIIKSLLSKAVSVKSFKCECPKDRSFRCGFNMCALNSKACNAAGLAARKSCKNSRNDTLVSTIGDSRFSRF